MITTILWNIVITAGFVSCIVVAYWIWFHFPERTVDDVVDFLLPVDLEKAESLLNSQDESALRSRVTRAEFRKLQRKHMHLYLSLVQKMSHNASILVEWANRAVEQKDGRARQHVSDLQQAAVAVRLYSLLTIVKLRFWLLIRVDSWQILPAPSLSDLQETGGVRGLESYERLKTAASFLFLETGNSSFEELLHNL